MVYTSFLETALLYQKLRFMRDAHLKENPVFRTSRQILTYLRFDEIGEIHPLSEDNRHAATFSTWM